MDRDFVDLTYFSDTYGYVGHGMTLAWHNVLPGDGYSLNVAGDLRFSPLRRNLTKDAKVDIATFFTPFRHIYGDTWVNYIEQGYDETQSLPTATIRTELRKCPMFGMNFRSTTVPLWAVGDLPRIWNHYYRPPALVTPCSNTVFNGATSIPWVKNGGGFRAAYLKRVWNTYMKNNITSADTDVSVSSGKWSLLDMDRQKAILRGEQEREFFNIRYRDIIRDMGGKTFYDADERPMFINRMSFWSSGYNVDGTDQSSLGQYTGRMNAAFSYRVPRFYVPEHGIVRTILLVRYPPMVQTETDYLLQKNDPSYQMFSGDYDLMANQPPERFISGDWFTDRTQSETRQRFVPFGQWFRCKANFVADKYDELQGYPHIENIPFDNITGTNDHSVLHAPDQYNNMFQTQQLGHFQISSRNNCMVARHIPSARKALLAGV